MFLRRSCLQWLAVGLLVASSAGTAVAQCMPDNLTGPCCAQTQVRLPQFPRIQSGVKYICWDECNPRLNRDVCLDLGQPTPATQGGVILCGVYRISYSVRTCGAASRVLWSGVLTAHYSRNWLESSIAGGPPDTGVWRFILNGDIAPSSFVVQRYGTNTCVVPPCFFTYNRFYVQGYIDYAQNCQTQQWTAAGTVYHGCDAEVHNPSSARPAPATGFHTRSYSWVWPAAGFVPFSPTAIGPRSQGPIIQEAVRVNDWTTPANLCRFEEPVQSGQFQPINEFCYCTAFGSPNPQYIDTQVFGAGACGTNFRSAGPLRFLQKRIGGWTAAATFPGQEYLLLDFGDLNYVNGCNMLTTNEYFEGVETIGGFRAQSYTGVVLGLQFEDLASSNVSTAAGPVRIIGVPHISWYILNLNLP